MAKNWEEVKEPRVRRGAVVPRAWDWQTATEAELRGLELVASGYTPALAEQMVPGSRCMELERARLTGWIECRDMVRARLVREQKSDFQNTIGVSQRLVLQALTGEIEANDPRVKLATVALKQTLWRLIRSNGSNGLLDDFDEAEEGED